MAIIAEYKHIYDIPVESLLERGIRAVMVDLDNTLAPWHEEVVDPQIHDWVQSLLDHSIEVCLLSNSKSARAHRMQERFGIPYGIYKAGKPFGSGYSRALKLMNVERDQAVMIGDQICTDVLGAKVRKIPYILLDPIAPREMKGTYALRWIERNLFRRKPLEK